VEWFFIKVIDIARYKGSSGFAGGRGMEQVGCIQ